MGRRDLEAKCQRLGLENLATDAAIDKHIEVGRAAYGWNAEQSEIWDRTCSHVYETVLTRSGVARKSIECGDVE